MRTSELPFLSMKKIAVVEEEDGENDMHNINKKQNSENKKDRQQQLEIENEGEKYEEDLEQMRGRTSELNLSPVNSIQQRDSIDVISNQSLLKKNKEKISIDRNDDDLNFGYALFVFVSHSTNNFSLQAYISTYLVHWIYILLLHIRQCSY